jgi:hypothetical protein
MFNSVHVLDKSELLKKSSKSKIDKSKILDVVFK